MSFSFSAWRFEKVEALLFAYCAARFRWQQWLGRRKLVMPPRRALIFITDHFGDTLILLPGLSRWMAAHPGTEVRFVTGTPIARKTLKMAGFHQATIDIDEFKKARLEKKTSRTLRRQAVQAMREFAPDICLLTHQSRFRCYQALAFLSGAPQLVVTWREGDPVPLGDRIVTATKTQSVLEVSNTLFDAPGAASLPGFLAPKTTPPNKPPIVLLHPGAKQAYKFWPPEQWRELIRRLVQEERVEVRVPISSFDAAQINAVLEPLDPALQSAVQRVQAEELTDLAERLKEADLFICLDSGPMHLAGLLGLRGVAIYGSRAVMHWTPPNAERFSLLFPEEEAAEKPAASSPPPTHPISFERVWDAVRFQLRQ